MVGVMHALCIHICRTYIIVAAEHILKGWCPGTSSYIKTSESTNLRLCILEGPRRGMITFLEYRYAIDLSIYLSPFLKIFIYQYSFSKKLYNRSVD